MKKGDIFVLISEGIFKQTNEENSQFGIDKIADFITQNAGCKMTDLIDSLHNTLVDFSKNFGYDDNLTILLIKRV